ncbi:MAG: glycosyltransferase family 2 protein [Hyphomicrobiaceae bacterium]
MTTITIAIASSGRRMLVRCLTSLAALELPAETIVDIVIADDSLQGLAAGLVAEALPLPYPVRIVPTAARNVSVARNACIDAATGELIAFVDDDEWVEPDWLVRMLAAMREFSADCVFGPVHPVYPVGTADWIVRANPLHVDWGRRGRKVTLGRGGNALLRQALVKAAGLRFDPALGRTGGEDTSFFHALGQSGAVMVVTDDAMVHEDAPPARVNVAYFRQRALRTGQIYARFIVSGLGNSLLARAKFYAGAALKAGVALTIGTLAYPFDKALWLRFAMRGWMNVGKLRELLRLEPSHMS